jgi:hypothetical protein
MLTMIFMIVALLCFFLATGQVFPQVNLIALGLAFWILTEILKQHGA